MFVRSGSIVPEQPLVQSTEEKPNGPLTLRVYPPVAAGQDCSGSLYLDDGVSYAFEKGEFLRVAFHCRQTSQGLAVTVDPRNGSFAPWWKQLSIEVYGATKTASAASARVGDAGVRSFPTSYDAEHHRIVALIPDDAKGLELQLAY